MDTEKHVGVTDNIRESAVQTIASLGYDLTMVIKLAKIAGILTPKDDDEIIKACVCLKAACQYLKGENPEFVEDEKEED